MKKGNYKAVASNEELITIKEGEMYLYVTTGFGKPLQIIKI